MKIKTRERMERILMFAKRIHDIMETTSASDFLADELKQDAILKCFQNKIVLTEVIVKANRQETARTKTT